MNVVQLREDEPSEAIIKELLADCDNAMQVDCAGPTVRFVVQGWFVFPNGSMGHKPEVTSAT